MALKDELEDWYVAVAYAKSGVDLLSFLNEYKIFLKRINIRNLHVFKNWDKELDSVIRKVESKKTVKNIEQSPSLKSFRDDATDAVHAINGFLDLNYSATYKKSRL